MVTLMSIPPSLVSIQNVKQSNGTPFVGMALFRRRPVIGMALFFRRPVIGMAFYTYFTYTWLTCFPIIVPFVPSDLMAFKLCYMDPPKVENIMSDTQTPGH